MLLPDSIKPGRASVTVTLLNGVFPKLLTAIGYTLMLCKTISIFIIETAVLMMAIAGLHLQLLLLKL
jgi:hypothetical protein